MADTIESTTSRRSSRLYLAALVFCWLVFAFFTAVQFLRTDGAAADERTMKELDAVKLVPSQASANDWPQWRGPQRDGVSTETGLLTTWPEGGPKLLWQAPTGEGFSAPAIARGRVYSMVQDHDQEVVVCWDEATGREIWRRGYPAHFRQKFGNGPRGTPTIDGVMVYTMGATGVLTCLKDAGDQAEPVWQKKLLEEFGVRNLEWGLSASPLVENGLVYVNTGGQGGRALVAFDKKTGDVVWQTQDDGAANSSPVLVTIAGQSQVVFLSAEGLVAVTPDKGETLWRYPWHTDFDANTTTPLVVGDFVYVSTGYGKGCGMVKVENKDGKWSANLVYQNRNMRSHFTTCVRHQDHLYGFNDSTLTCMELRTGKVAWTQRGFDKGSLTMADGHLFVLGEYGNMAVAEATPAGYREKGQFRFSSKRCWTMPVIANGRLFLRDQERLACFDIKK